MFLLDGEKKTLAATVWHQAVAAKVLFFSSANIFWTLPATENHRGQKRRAFYWAVRGLFRMLPRVFLPTCCARTQIPNVTQIARLRNWKCTAFSISPKGLRYFAAGVSQSPSCGMNEPLKACVQCWLWDILQCTLIFIFSSVQGKYYGAKWLRRSTRVQASWVE